MLDTSYNNGCHLTNRFRLEPNDYEVVSPLCQLIVASPLVVPSLRRSLVVLLRQLVVASPLAVLSLRCPLVVLSRQLVVALPLVVLSMRHPLVNSSCQLVATSYRITSPHPLVAHRTALSSSRHAGWLLRRLSACSPLVILSSRCATSRCLVAPAGCRAIISWRTLVAPPSRPLILIVLAGCCFACPCAALLPSGCSSSPTPSNTIERCCNIEHIRHRRH